MGEQSLRVLMTKMIADCALSFNVGKNIDLKQAYETSELILKDFNDWKMPDIQLCFNRAKAGRYGNVFDRLDCNVIMNWCSAYDMERMTDISNEQTKRAGDMKGLVREPFAALERVDKSIIPNHKTQQETSEMQHFFNAKYSHWEKLVEKFGEVSGGFRYIKRYGKMLNGSDYVSYKLEQKKNILKNRKYD